MSIPVYQNYKIGTQNCIIYDKLLFPFSKTLFQRMKKLKTNTLQRFSRKLHYSMGINPTKMKLKHYFIA